MGISSLADCGPATRNNLQSRHGKTIRCHLRKETGARETRRWKVAVVGIFEKLSAACFPCHIAWSVDVKGKKVQIINAGNKPRELLDIGH
jgi:hypothetical protein